MSLQRRMDVPEQQNRRLWIALSVVMIVILFALLRFQAVAAPADQSWDPQTLRLTSLEIIDSDGTVRARLGANLPDAIINGKRIGRGGETVSGLMLYDATGQERGGYVTFEPSGNIGLTLDTRKGQVALFAAGPDGGANLRLWNDADAIELRADGDGSRLTTVVDGIVSTQIPNTVEVGPRACSAYQVALDDYSKEQVMAACKQRFTSNKCTACLDREIP